MLKLMYKLSLDFENVNDYRPERVLCTRDAIFPDFSGIPDFHKSKLSMKNL